MRHYIFVFLVAIASLPTVAQAQTADVICDDSARLERTLSNVMHAERRAWIDPRTQNWTLVQTYTNGTSCIVAMGENWEDLTPAPA